MKKITHKNKIEWMAIWAAKNGLQLILKGECGFGRKCVGVSVDGHYPDYEWYDNEYNQIDKNGDVWIPKDAYHKHPCVAVLGRGKEAESQLYDWLKWFDDNGFKLETGNLSIDNELSRELAIFMGKHRYARMVRNKI